MKEWAWDIGYSRPSPDTVTYSVSNYFEGIARAQGYETQETAVINQRVDKTEEEIGQIPLHFQEHEQRVSDLEDHSLVWDIELGKLQKKLSESQNKMEDIENYVRRLNLHFVGVPKEAENQGNPQDMLQFMDDLIKTHILAISPADLTIMWAH
ncbi:hypothetical protein NDU88_008800 [Pleurodeles waltl]|uniref:Uncharacterized protein n=1 Tax=Pleurodeles waltl TaxID=8319 RepID=A0AAV7PT34_PLEWA|nr:hypothetical protein NDU88_008800 [Pleurodeles waltl]